MTRRLPPLTALRAFEAAGRHVSFIRAAEELHVSAAAISQQIKLLEETLDITLFRRGSPLALTDAALEALPLITDAFDRLERATEKLRAGRDGGPLVVSLPPSFAARWLIPRLQRFETAHPEIELRLSATTRLVNFEAEGVDLAIRYGTGHYPGLHTERLRTEFILAVAVPRLAEKLAVPADLIDAVLLHNQAMSWDSTFPDWPAWLRDAGVTLDRPLKIRPFGDLALVMEAVLAGLGVALAWRTLIEDDLAAGRLMALFPAAPLTNAYHLVCPPKKLHKPGVAALRAWIKAEMDGRPEVVSLKRYFP